MKICSNCGNVNPDGSTFCTNCGANLYEQVVNNNLNAGNSGGAKQLQKKRSGNLIMRSIYASVKLL